MHRVAPSSCAQAHELPHRAICLSNRVPMIAGTGQIRIRKRNPTVRLSP